jgi:hypothetical protein
MIPETWTVAKARRAAARWWAEAERLRSQLASREAEVERLRGDSERLIWMQTRDASFGTSGRFNGMQGGVPVWHEARFVRVPCRVLYEWHIYDGKDWREAIDNAMNGTPCCEQEDGRCVNGRFAPDERDHPWSQALDEARSALASLRGEVEAVVEAWQAVQATPTIDATGSTGDWVTAYREFERRMNALTARHSTPTTKGSDA